MRVVLPLLSILALREGANLSREPRWCWESSWNGTRRFQKWGDAPSAQIRHFSPFGFISREGESSPSATRHVIKLGLASRKTSKRWVGEIQASQSQSRPTKARGIYELNVCWWKNEMIGTSRLFSKCPGDIREIFADGRAHYMAEVWCRSRCLKSHLSSDIKRGRKRET